MLLEEKKWNFPQEDISQIASAYDQSYVGLVRLPGGKKCIKHLNSQGKIVKEYQYQLRFTKFVMLAPDKVMLPQLQ